MHLWLRLTLASLVAAVAPLFVLGVHAVELTGEQAEAARQAALEREAVAISEEVGRWLAHQEQALSGWMALYPGLADRSADQQLGLLRATFRAVPSVVTVALVLDDGSPLTHNSQPLPTVYLDRAPGASDPLHERVLGSEQRAKSWLARVVTPQPGQLAHVEAPWLPAAGPPAVPVAVRSRFEGERAVLAADVSLEQVVDILKMRSRGGWNVSLYAHSGERVVTNGVAIDGEMIRPLLTQDLAIVQLDDMGLRGALAAVPGVPWSVVVIENSGDGLEVDDPRWQLALAILVSLVVALLIGFIVSRPLSRPIEVLRKAANTIADGDLGHRVPEQGGPEIVELARAFNNMASRLAVSLAAISAHNAQLEDRVQERTAELKAAQRELVRAGQLAAVAEVGAGLAHELNNPLAGILGLAQVLRAGSSDAMERSMLEQVEQQTHRCREVVNAMLKLSSGGLNAHDEPVIDMMSVVTESAALVQGIYRQRGVTLIVDDAAERLAVRLDPVQGNRIITQILQSFCAGLSAGASLRVEPTVEGENICVRFVPDRVVAVGESRDDFMASGLSLWVARQMLDDRDGRLNSPSEGGLAWQMLLPKV